MKNQPIKTNDTTATAKTVDEAINLMFKIAETHGIKFVAITPEDFEDCDSFKLLTPEEKNRVIESTIEEIGETVSYAIEEGFELARKIAKK